MAEFGAPPSYDDVVPQPGPESSLQPTAPPLAHITAAEGNQPLPYYNDTPTATVTVSPSPGPAGQRRRSAPTPQTESQPSRREELVERYVSYSIAHHLRKYIEPRSEQQDPELDVEAQFGRSAVRSAQTAIQKKRALQCISGWLWCIGVMLVLLYIALPIAMITVGAVGIRNCPFRSGTILIYLIGGGVVLVVMVLMRVLPSIMTCLRNRNYFSMKESSACGECICATETMFYIVMIINFIVLILGTYTTFVEPKPVSCSLSPVSASNCCDTLVYVSSATFAALQYVLYAFTGLFVCVVLSCIRGMDKEMSA